MIFNWEFSVDPANATSSRAAFDEVARIDKLDTHTVKVVFRMNDMVVQSAVVIPVTWRNVLHAAATNLAGIEPNGWDSVFGRIAYWYRLG